jgi:uncharacterized protein YndB with AHSA1/START domain
VRAFSFHSTWWLPHPVADVHTTLIDVERYPEWWPQVVACLKLGPDDGLVLCRSTLPYTLEMRLHAERREPELLETSITGDLEGWVRWKLLPEDDGCRVVFEQEVVVHTAALALASYLVRPALRWNHTRMMEGARRGLTARLATTKG